MGLMCKAHHYERGDDSFVISNIFVIFWQNFLINWELLVSYFLHRAKRSPRFFVWQPSTKVPGNLTEELSGPILGCTHLKFVLENDGELAGYIYIHSCCENSFFAS